MHDYPLLCGLLALLLLSSIAAADVNRLLQAEMNSQSIGSRSYAAEGYLTLPRAGANTFKAVMLLAANTTTVDVLAKYTQQKHDLSGVVLLLPGGATMAAEDASRLLQLEEQLLSGPTVVPVFLAPETMDLSDAVLSTAAMFGKGSPPHQHLDRYQLHIQGSSPSKVAAKQAITYVASLKATDDQFKPGVPVAPTLVITAHYDSFSIAPAAPAGADSSSSGAAACLLLLRMLHRLYASPESRPSRNVVVVLTAGGPYAQEGLRQWIRDLEPAQLEALEAAVVLDSIASSTAMQQSSTSAACSSSSSSNMGTIGRTIHMHHAGRAGDAHWLSAISDAAARMGVSVTPVEQGVKPDGQAAAAGFGHEHLAKKGIPAVTLSSLPCSPVTQLGGRVRVSSLGDVAAGVNMDSVLAAAQVTVDAVTRWLYPDLDRELQLIDLGLDPEGLHSGFLQSWISLITEAQNMMPFDQSDPSGAELHDSLRQFMRAHSQGGVKRHVWSTAGTAAELTAWSGTTATLKVHKAAGALLDMLLTAGVLLYLVGLWVVLRVCWHGWSDVTALFSPKPVRRSRGGGYKRN